MRNYFDVLKNCPLFAGLNEEETKKVLSCMGAKTGEYGRGQAVFLAGDSAKYVAVALSGRVSVVREDYFGNRDILTSVGPSEIFAEAFACAGTGALPVSVIADEDSKILLLDCARMLNTCQSACGFYNRLIQNLLRVVAAKNIVLNRKLELMSKRTTKEKLMSYLTGEAKRAGSREFTIPYDRQELADYLGVERSAMSAQLSSLRRQGVIDFHKSRFVLMPGEHQEGS